MDNQATDDRPPKRRKVRVACQECRDKKTRCDGERPVCQSCQRKGLPCTYLDTPAAADFDPHYIKSLEDRIRDLERTSSSNGPERVGSAPAPASIRVSHEASQGAGSPTPTTATASAIQGGTSHDSHHIAAVHLMDLHQNHQRDPSYGGEHRNSAEFHHPGHGHPDPGNGRDLDHIPSEPPHLQLYHPTHQIDSRPPQSHEHTGGDGEDSDENTPGDAMGASEGTPGKAGRGFFLGPSSVAAFMKTVQETTGIGAGMSGQVGREDGAPSTTSRTSYKRATETRNALETLLSGLTMPPRKLADTHLASYWHYSHLLYPILHRPSFMRKYEEVWARSDGSEDDLRLFDGSVHQLRAFYATLNIALALGCSLTPGPQSAAAQATARTLFERSQALLRDADVDHGSVQLVQALILTAQYLQSTDMANRCWVTVGTAIRIAQGIGIQVNRSSESQAEREERRRTWWCCLLLDRVLSMTFGRPPMVVWPTEVPIPEPVDDELLSQEVGSACQPLPSQDESTNAFFTHTLRLSDSLMSVLRCLYRSVDERRRDMTGKHPLSDLSLIVEIDGDLAQWRSQLPPYLVYHPDDATSTKPDSPIFKRQCVVLQARYLHLRTLLFRRITMELSHSKLFSSEPSGTSTDFQSMALGACISSCVRAAEELVDLINARSTTHGAPPWWYSIFYMYSCGSVLLSVLLSSNLQRACGETIEKLSGSWTRCMETLLHFERLGSKFARHCRRTLNAAITPRVGPQDPNPQESFDPNMDPQVTGQDNGHLYQVLPLPNQPEALVDMMTFHDMWPAGSQDWLNSLPDDQDDVAGDMRFATMM